MTMGQQRLQRFGIVQIMKEQKYIIHTTIFCFGVKNAIDGAEKELENNSPIYCLGEILSFQLNMNYTHKS